MKPTKRTLAEQRPQVALLIESSRAYGRGLLQGISRYVREQGQWSVYFQERRQGDPYPTWLKGWKGDGIIARVEDREMAEAIARTRLPAVDLRGLLLDLKLPLIETNEERVVQLAIEHLRERGFRHFAFCGFVGANYSDKRSQLFTRLLDEHGFSAQTYSPPEKLRQGDTFQFEQHGLVYEADVADWLRQLPRPVGVMACNDVRGQQVLNACRQIGVHVPDEVAVIGVDNDEVLCDLSDPPLTSVIPNTERIGYEAAALLERMMAGQPAPSKTIYIEPSGIATRQSTEVLAMEDRHIAAAVRFIRENACRGITVTDLLAVAPLSRSVLERRFNLLLGHSPKTEILRVQIQRAKQLLAETDLPLAVIAEKTGFTHPEYFNVAFKNKVGVTPGRFRAQAH